MTKQTVFERVATDKPEEHLFLSRRHGIMAVVDIHPKLPLQCVVAPTTNDPAAGGYFNRLPRIMRQKLYEVADAVGEKVLANCTADERAITHIEGFGVPEHPHIVLFAAERQQGEDLYNGEKLGPLVVKNTLEVIRFTPDEAAELESRLDRIDECG